MLKNWAQFAGFSAFALFALVGCLLWALNYPPQDAEWTCKAQETASQPNQNPVTFLSCRRPQPTKLQDAARGTDGKSTQNTGEDIKVTDKLLAIFTGLLVLVGGFQAYWLWGTVEATRIVAEAALSQANATIDLERPRLWLSATRVEFDAETIGKKSIVCVYRIENFGRTPAMLESYDVNLRIYSVLPAVPDYKLAFPARRILYQREVMGEKDDLRVPLLSIDKDGVDTLGTATNLYLFGNFQYRDVFGASIITGFCYRSDALSGRLFREGGEAYNYDQREA